MSQILPEILAIFREVVRHVIEFKIAVNKFLIPYTNRLDVFELLLIWSVILIILIKFFALLDQMSKDGYKKSIVRMGIKYARKLPMVQTYIEKELAKAKTSLENDVNKHRKDITREMPAKGINESAVKEKLRNWYKDDHKYWSPQKISGCLYNPATEKTPEIVKEIAKDYFYQNPLHFDLFPSVAQMEAEVISIVKKLYHGDDDSCGLLTSGGTESIMMSMLSYREWGRERGITEPEIVAPETAHVAFEKAAFYYCMRVKWVKVDKKTGLPKLSDMKAAITKNTVCLVGSCPNYPYGSVDPIEEFGKLAKKYGIGLHCDCCLGGFIAPFAEDAGLKTKFDFRCKDVTSISVDPHKYGLAPKGVSVALFRSNKLRNGAIFSSSEWLGGIYATPTHAGSRGGAASVGAWTAIMINGYEGYREKARNIIEGTKKAAAELKKNKHIHVVGDPYLGTLSFLSDTLNCFDIADHLSKKGWHAATLQYPPGVHISITGFNLPMLDDFVKCVNEATEFLASNTGATTRGSTAQLYGSAAKMPESIVKEGGKLIMDAILKV